MSDRDITSLKLIVKYSDEISGTIGRFDLDYNKFKDDYVVKNAISMCILQIGEVSGRLTDEFKKTHDKMPWRDIIALRNRAAHAYESADMEILWKTVVDRVPELKAYCESILNENMKTK